ncbi:hypothetical protein [Microvirga sp. 17 mud 1-3]|uniref:hypothetical protein n=1 Tax=Microvirga sp. 17 mud 1-3 TaxID=2082949 RepID=UPI0013A59249|nr:hypothetical protein [Microvirga sp. 17 mud 1-3]
MNDYTKLFNRFSAAGYRLFRATVYALTAYCLLRTQSYYQFSFFLMSVAIFGLSLINGTRWIANSLLFVFVVISVLPKGLPYLDTLYALK